jgi:pimeloyl-ACP methyl ester carboxylesterase
MKSIYNTSEYQKKLMEIYDTRLEQWPSSYKSIFIDSAYGKVHVIASGPEDAPPVLLLHAASLSASSWLYNIEGLNRHYRTFAIDNIGEAGKSVLDDPVNYPKDGKSLSELYMDIMDKLGVEQSYLIGASNGGYIATSCALYAPARIKKLALLGPMGLTPATDSVVSKLSQFSTDTTESFKEHIFNWSLGDNPRVIDTCGEWFSLVMDGVTPSIADPETFKPAQLREIKVPILLILGNKDNLVGDPDQVKELALCVPDIQIEVLDSGHGISIEQPEVINTMIHKFFDK